MNLARLSGVNDDIWATNDHFYFQIRQICLDGFLFDLEACLINLKLPQKLLICSDVLKGDFGGLERFRWLSWWVRKTKFEDME